MKRIIFLLLILITTASGCSFVPNYQAKLKDTHHIIEFDSQLSVVMINAYSKLWSNSAANGLKYEDEVAGINDKAKDSLDLLREDKTEVDKMMKKLSSPASRHRSAYDKLNKCYGVYCQLYDMVFAPIGTPPPDSQKIIELQNKLKNSSDEFKALVP